jgi:hypothetical protein
LAAAAAGLALMAACGGGAELLLAVVVTPLNGTWRLDGNAGKEALGFTTSVDVHLFSNQYALSGTLLNPSDRCGVPAAFAAVELAGTFDNGRIMLRAKDAPGQPVCIEAQIVSLIRFDALATGVRPARFYENSRVDVQMGLGIWVSDGGGTRLKFSDVSSVDNNSRGEPIRACDRSPGITPVVLDGLMDGFQKATQTRPAIAALTQSGQTSPRYTAVDYVDGATLTLRASSGTTVTLRRQRESVPTVCP